MNDPQLIEGKTSAGDALAFPPLVPTVVSLTAEVVRLKSIICCMIDRETELRRELRRLEQERDRLFLYAENMKQRRGAGE